MAFYKCIGSKVGLARLQKLCPYHMLRIRVETSGDVDIISSEFSSPRDKRLNAPKKVVLQRLEKSASHLTFIVYSCIHHYKYHRIRLQLTSTTHYYFFQFI